MEKKYAKSFYIKGMHCLSCEMIIKDSLQSLPNVSVVNINHKSGVLEIETTFDNFDLKAINDVISKHGYQIINKPIKDFQWFKFFGYLVFFIVLAFVLSRLNWFNGGGKLESPVTAFTFGLLASLSSCLAVVGGVVIALGSLWSEVKSKTEQVTNQVLFQLGRFITFVLLGGLLGSIGSVFNFSFNYASWLMILVGLLMLVLAFKQLAVIRFSFGKNISWINKLNQLSASKNPFMPFIIGGLTFFLPCGFTQTVQLYAVASGSFVVGAIVNGLFALGTMPVLLILGFSAGKLNKFGKPIFTKITAVVIGVFAIIIMNNGLSLLGWPMFNSSVISKNQNPNNAISLNDQGEQVVKMVADYSGYTPNRLEVKVGVPVKWQIIGKEIGGCNAFIVVPEYKIKKKLELGLNEIIFTPTKKGKINFSCGMGMIPGQFIVTD